MASEMYKLTEKRWSLDKIENIHLYFGNIHHFGKMTNVQNDLPVDEHADCIDYSW